MAIAGLILYAITANRDDTWGYAVGYPLIGVTIATVAIIVLAFAEALRAAISGKKLSLIQKSGITVVLFGVPFMGMAYASNGQNRTRLWVLSLVFLGATCAGLIYMTRRSRK